MTTIWTELTIPQANVLAGLFTMVAAIVAIVAGGMFFDRKVRSLQEAIKSTERDLEKHISNLQTALAGVKDRVLEKVAEIEEITLATGERAANESGKDSLVDQIDAVEEAGAAPQVPEPKVRLMAAWEDIRTKLEATVSDEAIDGRTRAKYLRIDRRSYRDLISAILRDGRLVPVEEQLFRAVALRNQFKRGRMEVSEANAEEMETLRDLIASQQG